MATRARQSGWLSDQHLRVSSDGGSLLGRDAHGGERLARGILRLVLCGFLAVEAIDILTSPLPARGMTLAVGVACIAIVFVLQLYISSARLSAAPLRARLAVLLAQGLVTYLPLGVLGSEWGGLAGFFAGSILLLVPGWPAWAAFGAVIGSMLIWPLAEGLGAYSTAYLAVASMDIGLVVFGLSRLSLIISYLRTARTQLAQLAVVQERERFAKDLHDLLGYSLSAITLKAELTKRLVPSAPDRANDELAELLDIARQALADVRIVASGYRDMSLEKEAASVASLLSMADIETSVDIACGPLDGEIDTVLATVLREAVTNMLRHSKARTCVIEAATVGSAVRLRVANDGLQQSARSHREGGGLENLAERLAKVSGRLTVSAADGEFEIVATVGQDIARRRRDEEVTQLADD
jgi:two-component system sensor histidine kinase DesK